MQTGKKNVKEWNKILIDTGMVFSLFASKNGSTDPNILFVNKLLINIADGRSYRSPYLHIDHKRW
jgi:hypothetical protein